MLTPLLALSAEGWVLIIGAIGMIVVQVTTAVLAYFREQAKIEREEDAARLLAENLRQADIKRTEIAKQQAEIAKQQTVALANVVDKVEVVHVATNSLTEKLLKKTEEAGLARGGLEEKREAEAKAEAKAAPPEIIEGLAPVPLAAGSADLKRQIAAVPEKTAKRVVEKLEEQKE